jgi:hypothetical protein
MTDQPRVQCSAAGLFRDRHMATDRQYHLTDPDGQLFVFCSACCLLEYAVWGLPADAQPCHSLTPSEGEAA